MARSPEYVLCDRFDVLIDTVPVPHDITADIELLPSARVAEALERLASADGGPRGPPGRAGRRHADQ
ncbi:hypothetical protein ACQPYE_10610 [Actinosynnema sp. CA-299493]